MVGPPANVTVQALSNDSVVLQWDFDEQLNGGLADGFVVKYIHEPARNDHSTQNMDLWKAQTVCFLIALGAGQEFLGFLV